MWLMFVTSYPSSSEMILCDGCPLIQLPTHSYLSSLPERTFPPMWYRFQDRMYCVNSSLTWGETNGFLLEVANAIPISTKWGGMGCILDRISAHRLPVKHPSWSSARKYMQCVAMVANSCSETWLSMWLVRTIGGQAVGLEEEVSLYPIVMFSSANGAVI